MIVQDVHVLTVVDLTQEVEVKVEEEEEEIEKDIAEEIEAES